MLATTDNATDTLTTLCLIQRKRRLAVRLGTQLYPHSTDKVVVHPKGRRTHVIIITRKSYMTDFGPSVQNEYMVFIVIQNRYTSFGC